MKNICKNNYILSFILGALAYYMFLSYSQMAGGKYILLDGDTLDGVIPSFMTFYDNLIKGKSVSYTWASELGINSYIGLSGMMIFNISMPFYLIFHNFDYSIITVVILIIKAGLTSCFFYLYMDKVWNIKGIRTVIFSVCYAMCAFWVVYVPAILQFADAIYMLPLILFLVSKFADNGKFRMMSGAYLYIFLNFYYSAYIVGFFSLFYLILYMIFINNYSLKTIIKKLLIFGLVIVFTAGLLGVILYPTAYFIMTKYAEDATAMVEMHKLNILDIYNQLFVGQVCGYYTVYPYIYCGLPTLILFPLYFFNKRIKSDEKIVFTTLIVIMFISCLLKPLYLFWHLFDAPDGDPYRFSFIISFLLCVVACKQSEYITDIKKKILFLLIFINIGIYVVCKFIQPLYQMEYLSYPKNTWKYLIINASFLIGYFVWLSLYEKYNNSENNKKGMEMLLVMIVIAETVVNGYSGYYKNPGLYPHNNTDTYKLWNDTVNDALEYINEDKDGFYRISSEGDYITNAPLYFNYNGISSFTNMENYEVRKALEYLGLMTSPRDIFCNGLTDFTRMLLAVRYNIENVGFGYHRDYVMDFDQHAQVEKNNTALSLGFIVDEDIIDFSFLDRNQFENINSLAKCISGDEYVLYDKITEGIDVRDAGIVIMQDEEGNFAFGLDPENEEEYGFLFFTVPYDQRDAYVQFDYGYSVFDNKAPIICDGMTGVFNKYERVTGSFIKQMIRLDDGFEIALFMMDGMYTLFETPKEYNFYYYNKDEFYNLYDSLKDNQMTVTDYDNGYVKGNINIFEDNKVLFTSIPYDEGWEIRANGVKIEPVKLINDAFIGLQLPKGYYDLEFKYHVPGLKTGAIISSISLMLLMILFVINPNFKPELRKRNKENEFKDE